jgi:hypothetical protein
VQQRDPQGFRRWARLTKAGRRERFGSSSRPPAGRAQLPQAS